MRLWREESVRWAVFMLVHGVDPAKYLYEGEVDEFEAPPSHFPGLCLRLILMEAKYSPMVVFIYTLDAITVPDPTTVGAASKGSGEMEV